MQTTNRPSEHLTNLTIPSRPRRGRVSKVMMGVFLAVAAVVASPWAPIASASGVQFSGDGSIGRPFTSDGCTASTREGDCIVEFPARYLAPLQNEEMPAYRCPIDTPLLVNRESNRRDRSPRGVDVVTSDGLDTYNPGGTSPVGDGNYYAAGTSRGGLWTATNWGLHDGRYFVALFCTDNYHRAYIS